MTDPSPTDNSWDQHLADCHCPAIPAIDPAAIREAALREAVKSLRIWHAIAHSLYPNSATTVGMAADVVEALIGEKK